MTRLEHPVADNSQRIAVLGSGTMGNGIAQVCATYGLQVALQDVDDAALERALGSIDRSLQRLRKAEKLTDDQVQEAKGRITTTTELAAAVDGVDAVIEAVPEKLELKQTIFADLERMAPSHAVLASNTSNFSITAIAAATDCADRVIGMHWFNPAPVMRLIEIVRGLETSDETLRRVEDLATAVGKETVVCKDAQGFITTRAVIALTMEACRMLEEGVATKEDIDKAIRLGLNHPMGPLELADLTGLDTTLSVAEAMTEAYGERFRSPNVLRTLVRAKHYGRKTGRGMYTYES
jgi:3-hydroxybutyryl-CoA dehydrogenase